MIYENVQRLCAKEGISTFTLEKKLNLGNATISRWKDSSPNIKTAKAVADYFRVTVDELLRDETGE